MRYLILLGLGMLLGALAASTALNAFAHRDAYPRGVMNVLQHHYGNLRERLRDPKCATVAAGADRAMLAALTEEIASSQYGSAAPDAPFREYADRLRGAVADLPPQPAACRELAPIVTRIGNACDACHRQYR